jgi:uncharacterized membrane protein
VSSYGSIKVLYISTWLKTALSLNVINHHQHTKTFVFEGGVEKDFLLNDFHQTLPSTRIHIYSILIANVFSAKRL